MVASMEWIDYDDGHLHAKEVVYVYYGEDPKVGPQTEWSCPCQADIKYSDPSKMPEC